MPGIITEEDDDGNAASYNRNVQPQPVSQQTATLKNGKTAKGQKPLNELLIEPGLEDLLALYRQYLQAEYACAFGNLSQKDYEEQKIMRHNRKKEVLAIRDCMRKL